MNKIVKRTLAASVGAVMVLTAFAGAQIALNNKNSASSLKASAQTSTLLAHYDFNGITGTAVPDITGNGYDGVLDGSDYSVNEESVSFNEKSDSNYGSGVKLNKNVFNDTSDEVTIMAWVKPSTSASENAIRTFFNLNSGSTSNTSSYALWITKFSGQGLRYLNGSMVQTNSVLPQNQWSLITLVQTKDTNYLYLNDALVTSFDCANRLCDIKNGVVTFAKAITWPDKGFKGAVDDIKIYSEAFSELEVAQEYQKTMYPISGFSVGGYNAAIDQKNKTMLISLPENFSLENVSPIVTTTASEIKINGQMFNEGDTVTLNDGENIIGYKTEDESGAYTLNIYSDKLKMLADFDFAAENISADGVVSDRTGSGYTAKLGDYAQSKEEYVNLNGGYIDIDPQLIADTKAALTLSFTVSIEKDSELQHTLFSAGNADTGRLLLSTDYRSDCEGPRWALKTGASGESVVKSNNFLGYEKWMHITYTQSNAVAKIYVDGICVASGTSILPASMIGSAKTYIGKATDSGDNSGLRGQIAELAVYSGAMTDSEVASFHAENSLPGSYEIVEPSDATCDLLGFAYPNDDYTMEIDGYNIKVKTDSSEKLSTPTVTVSDNASYTIRDNLLIITAPNGVDQMVYVIDIEYPKSNAAQLDTVTVNDIAAEIDEHSLTVKAQLPIGTDASLAVVEAKAKDNGTAKWDKDKITVTAEDGKTTVTYTLEISVKKNNTARLESVTVNGKEASIDQTAKTVSVQLAHGEKVTDVKAAAGYNGTAQIAADHKTITVTAEDGVTTASYKLNITNAAAEQIPEKPQTPQTPQTTVYKNKIVGKTAYDANGNKITGTKVVKISGAYRAVVNGKVQTGTKIVKVGKTYRAVKNGKLVYRNKAALVKINKKTYAVSKKGIVKMKKLVTVNKKKYVNKSKAAGIYKNKTFKLKGKAYKANKKGVVKRKK